MSLFWFSLAVIGLALSVALAFFLFRRSSKKASVTEGPAAQTPKRDDYAQHLLTLNLDIRKAAIDTNLMTLCEAIIDKLVSLAPKLSDSAAPGGDLNWTVNRIATEYLPNKCVRPYLALSEVGRSDPGVKKSFETNLQALGKELDEVEALFLRKDMQEYNRKAEFLKHRFNIEGET